MEQVVSVLETQLADLRTQDDFAQLCEADFGDRVCVVDHVQPIVELAEDLQKSVEELGLPPGERRVLELSSQEEREQEDFGAELIVAAGHRVVFSAHGEHGFDECFELAFGEFLDGVLRADIVVSIVEDGELGLGVGAELVLEEDVHVDFGDELEHRGDWHRGGVVLGCDDALHDGLRGREVRVLREHDVPDLLRELLQLQDLRDRVDPCVRPRYRLARPRKPSPCSPPACPGSPSSPASLDSTAGRGTG